MNTVVQAQTGSYVVCGPAQSLQHAAVLSRNYAQVPGSSVSCEAFNIVVPNPDIEYPIDRLRALATGGQKTPNIPYEVDDDL